LIAHGTIEYKKLSNNKVSSPFKEELCKPAFSRINITTADETPSDNVAKKARIPNQKVAFFSKSFCSSVCSELIDDLISILGCLFFVALSTKDICAISFSEERGELG
jgi:hypothetical protein